MLSLTATFALLLALLPATMTSAEEHAPPARDIGDICPDEPSEPPFEDHEGTTHEEVIECLAHHGITIGFPDGTYRPNFSITRGEMASMLVRWVEEHTGDELDEPDEDQFDDIEDTAHRENINKIAEAEITVGVGDGSSFAPGQTVNRQVMATFVARTISYLHNGEAQPISDPPPTTEHYFPDVNPEGAHADSVNRLAEQGIVQGHEDGNYRPVNDVLRGQMAAFIIRAWDYVVTEAPDVEGTISGTVFSEEHDTAIEGATVTIENDVTDTMATGADGEFEFPDLAPGDYTVTADADGFDPDTEEVTLESGGHIEIDFRLETTVEPGSISGTVTDADTTDGIEGATVTAGAHEATTGGDGTYTIEDVPPGTYDVVATAAGFLSATLEVTVLEGEDVTVDFALEAIEFPLEITLDVIGGNVVLAERAELEDGESTTGACVDFGLEGLCEPAEAPDPEAEGISLTGTLQEDGTLTIPSEGVSFPDTEPEFLGSPPVWLGATIEFPDGIDGILDSETGEIQLEGLLTFALTFFEDDDGEPGDQVAQCTVGADINATHDDPGKATIDPTVQVDAWPAGEPYEDGIGRAAHTDFVVDGPLVQDGDGSQPGTCDSGFFGGVVMGTVNESLGISDGPNDDNYIGILFQTDPILN